MEVASPLTFGSASAKRHYPGSPPSFTVDNNQPFGMMMDSSTSTDEYGIQPQQQQRAFKRRRFNDESMDSDSENTQNHAFPAHAMVPKGTSFFHHQGKFFLFFRYYHSSSVVSRVNDVWCLFLFVALTLFVK
jgi:hypothetical protein